MTQEHLPSAGEATKTRADLEVLLPVHNEAESIEATIREIYSELSSKLSLNVIVCEDGSRDGTKDILRRLAEELPLRLNLCDGRRGYSRAVRDGMRMLEADFMLCLDSDGQCDPKDFWRFWECRGNADVVMGRRVDRADTMVRRTFSKFFYLIYQTAFHAPVHDPSCPYVLIRREVAQKMANELGAMQQGFWWEFVARVHRRGYAIKEIPVHHRLRASGVTQVYSWKKMPGIFFRHVAAIFQILSETRPGAGGGAKQERS